VYPHQNRKEAFKLFISHHIEKLYQEILSHSEFGADILAMENLAI
jgi:hypothetical protein